MLIMMQRLHASVCNIPMTKQTIDPKIRTSDNIPDAHSHLTLHKFAFLNAKQRKIDDTVREIKGEKVLVAHRKLPRKSLTRTISNSVSDVEKTFSLSVFCHCRWNLISVIAVVVGESFFLIMRREHPKHESDEIFAPNQSVHFGGNVVTFTSRQHKR